MCMQVPVSHSIVRKGAHVPTAYVRSEVVFYLVCFVCADLDIGIARRGRGVGGGDIQDPQE